MPEKKTTTTFRGIPERVFQHDGLSALVLNWDDDDEDRPLMLYLHGWGQAGRATDVEGLQVVKDSATNGLLSKKDIPSVHTATIIAPQCPPSQWWDVHAVHALLQSFLTTTQRKPTTLTVVGVSMGGYATWCLLQHYAPIFTSAVIMCGGDNPQRSLLVRVALRLRGIHASAVDFEALLRHRRLPRIYIVHGHWDPVVPFSSAKRCFLAVKSSTSVQLFGVPLRLNCSGLGHCVWSFWRDNRWWAAVLEQENCFKSPVTPQFTNIGGFAT